jgi:hypothetical protein
MNTSAGLNSVVQGRNSRPCRKPILGRPTCSLVTIVTLERLVCTSLLYL